MRTLVCCATDLSESSDEALRQAHALAERRDARLVVIHVLPSHAVSAEAAALVERAREAVTERVLGLTGRSRADFSLVVELGEPHRVIVEQAEALGASWLVVGSLGASGLGRQLLGSEADRVVRYAHCPVLVARPSPPSHRILAATDFSDPALPAVETAAHEARQRNAQLTLVHSLDLPRYLAAMGSETLLAATPTTAISIEALEQQAHERLVSSLDRFGATAETIVASESPARAIVRLADELKAELVVVGTVGKTGLKRMVLGSVAERVVETAPCSVLVVRLHRAA